MSGFAAELRGARDWMKVATAGEGGIRLYTCKRKVVHLHTLVKEINDHSVLRSLVTFKKKFW